MEPRTMFYSVGTNGMWQTGKGATFHTL